MVSLMEKVQKDNEGVLIKNEVEKYEGSFSKGKYNGFGTLKDKVGVYEGEFINGRRHGKGKVNLNNGNEIICSWRFGKPTGKGIITNMATGESREGEWKDGKFSSRSVKVTNTPQVASGYQFDWDQIMNYYGYDNHGDINFAGQQHQAPQDYQNEYQGHNGNFMHQDFDQYHAQNGQGYNEQGQHPMQYADEYENYHQYQPAKSHHFSSLQGGSAQDPQYNTNTHYYDYDHY